MNKGKKKLYLFDFDGTLTHYDSLFDFLKETQANYKQGWLKMMPQLVLAKLGILAKSKVKEEFISFFLKGKSKEELETLAKTYFEKNHQRILRKNAVEFIQNINPIDDKYLVSASLDIWLQPFAENLGLQLISTQAAFKNSKYTGKFASPNCNYEEKAQRIKNEIPLEQYSEIIAYGDSKGDGFMYELSDKSLHRYFHQSVKK